MSNKYVSTKEYGRSVSQYFQELRQKAAAQPKEAQSGGKVRLDSFGQWREADAGTSGDRDPTD